MPLCSRWIWNLSNAESYRNIQEILTGWCHIFEGNQVTGDHLKSRIRTMLSSKRGNCWLDLLSWKKTTVVPFFFFFCILFSWVAFWQPTRRAELIITKSMNLRVWSLKITRRELENMNTCYKSGPGREHMNTSHFLDKETFFNCWHTDRQLHHRNEAIFGQSHDSLLGSNSEVIFLTEPS